MPRCHPGDSREKDPVTRGPAHQLMLEQVFANRAEVEGLPKDPRQTTS